MIRSKNDLRRVYFYFYLILIIFTSGSVYSYVYSPISNLVKMLVIILGFFFPVAEKKYTNNKASYLYISVVIVFLLFNMFVTKSPVYNVTLFIMRMVAIMTFFLICFSKGMNIREMTYICFYVIISIYLVGYFLCNFDLFGIPYKYISVGVSSGNIDNLVSNVLYYKSYLGVFFRNQTASLAGFEFGRLIGPFNEPGLYQIIINYCIYYYLYIKENKKIEEIIVLITSLIFCNSTMGYLIFIVIFSLCYFKKINAFNIILGTILTILGIFLIKGIIIEKMSTLSYLDRSNDAFTMIKLLAEKPIIGWGFNQGSYSTNGLLTLIVSFGIGSLFLLIPFFQSNLYFSNGKLNCKIAFVIYLFCSLINQPIGLSNIFLFFFVIGAISIFKKGVKNVNNRNSNL